jgi:Global regulator protein family
MKTTNGRLVIGMREGESVYIGDDIEVNVNKAGTRVELAITAPKDVKILRMGYEGEHYGEGYSKFRATRG